MEPLLLLVHRIPYPPNKGDKIRSYHLLRHLATRYRVFLGAFVDDPQDWQYQATVQQWCEGVCLRGLNPGQAKLRSLSGFLTGEPLSLPYYRDARMASWVQKTIAEQGIRRVVVFSSQVAQYVEHLGSDVRRLVDFVDVDSDKWSQYAATARWPMSVVYRREARLLRDYERRIANAFDVSLLVSQQEAALFKRLVPEAESKVVAMSNGVDHEYFSPAHDLPNPYPPEEIPLVFTGAMDYWANVDAVSWFAREVFPQLYDHDHRRRFYIVGTRPTPAVAVLGQIPGVVVTGAVPDVRPYLALSALAVAPMRIARGVQNKVLEAMSMARAVVITPQALEGIAAQPGKNLILAETTEQQVCVINQLLADPDRASQLGKAARSMILDSYSWDCKFSILDEKLEQGWQ